MKMRPIKGFVNQPIKKQSSGREALQELSGAETTLKGKSLGAVLLLGTKEGNAVMAAEHVARLYFLLLLQGATDAFTRLLTLTKHRTGETKERPGEER